MKKILRITALIAACFGTVVSSAQADVHVWRDPVSKLTVSYADTWGQINNQNPHDVLTVRAPGAYDFAECKVNVADEGRFKIYPVRYSDEIQRLYVSSEYWDHYLGRYSDVVVDEVRDNAGLGDGYASMVSASYETIGEIKMQKRAIGFASHYRNKIYTVECSAEASAYDKWHNAFLNFVKSVDFRNGTNFAITGYYRDFLGDKTLKVRGPRVFEDSYY